MDVVLTWCSCKHDGEEVDAHSDGVEDRKRSEAIGDRVSLRGSVCEITHVFHGWNAHLLKN